MAEKNLIFQTAYWGDLLLAVPLMKAMRRQFPTQSLTLACRESFGRFFLEQGLVDELIEVDKSSASSRSHFAKRFRNESFHIAVVPHMSVRTALWVRSIRAERKIGYQQWWNSFAFSDRVKRPMDWPDALRQLWLLSPLDPKLKEQMSEIGEHLVESPRWRSELSDLNDRLFVPEWASMALVDPATEGSFKRPKPKVFIAPGSTWATKRWTVEGFAAVGRHFLQKGAEIVLVGTKKEFEICESVRTQLPEALNLAGKTEPQNLFHQFLTGDLLISNDSGAMHMGSLANIPTVAIFGPTTLDLGYRPWQNRALVVEKTLSCRPCGKHGHQSCPIKTHECMKQIEPSDVLKAVAILVPALG